MSLFEADACFGSDAAIPFHARWRHRSVDELLSKRAANDTGSITDLPRPVRVAPSSGSAKDGVAFGPFRLFARERLLERNGEPVLVGGRALDILICLVEHAGEVVSKKDLMARVWADVTVGEGCVRFHVASLRKALGDGQSGARYVANVPGRGYCLVAPVSPVSDRAAAGNDGYAPANSPVPGASTWKAGAAEIIVERQSNPSTARQCVIVVGPAGLSLNAFADAIARAALSAVTAARAHERASPATRSADAAALAPVGALPPAVEAHLASTLAMIDDDKVLLVVDAADKAALQPSFRC
jgi:DNA-binding winged helix-turn-helix (wHTH) protein